MDVFDFDDDQQVPSPATSPVAVSKGTISAKNLSQAQVLPFPGKEASLPSSQNSTSTRSNSTTSTTASTTHNPLKGGRTRHARRLARIQEQESKQTNKNKNESQQQQQGGKNGCSSPNKNKQVRFSKARRAKTAPQEENDDDQDTLDEEEEASSAASSSIVSSQRTTHGRPAATINPRRKRRRKQAPPTKNAKSSKFGSTAGKRPPIDTPTHISGTFSSVGELGGYGDNGSPLNAHQTNNNHNGGLSLSDQIRQKLQRHERQQQKLCGPSPAVSVSRKVRGAGGNVYAQQEVGQVQMLHDECHYLCSTIMTCPVSQLPAKANMVESVSELAVLLSSTKTRRTLWRDDGDGMSTLQAILDVIIHTTTALSERQTQHRERWAALKQKLQVVTGEATTIHDHSLMEPPSYHPNIVEEYYAGLLLDSLAAMVSFLSWDCTIANKASAYYQSALGARTLRKEILKYDGALPAILYIVRYADPVVTSILEPRLQSNVEHWDSNNNYNPQGNLPSPERLPAAKENDSKSLQQSQQSDQSSLQPQPSPLKHAEAKSINSSKQANDTDSVSSMATKEDPTAVGRRKRKRRRAKTALESIAEDATVAMSFTGGNASAKNGTLTPPRSPPRVVFQKQQEASDARTKLSFTTEDAMSPSRTPPRRRGGWRYPGNRSQSQEEDDGSSMVSCDSALLKIHDRLSTARARFILPPTNNKDTQKGVAKQHDCQDHRELPLSFGGKDPAGSASILALGGLRRMIAGKEEGDEYSCLDQVEEDSNSHAPSNEFMSPGDFSNVDDNQNHPTGKTEDDEALQNNPLLETNRMLGESGVIPVLARGVAETLAAAVEELQQKESSKPCRACLQHLQEKFYGLAAIVDGACLLHDDNRTDLCSATISDNDTNDDGLLLGSLVLFLKIWMSEKTPTSGTKQGSLGSLLGDMGMAALRTLTSLTHNNGLAAEQLGLQYRDIDNRKATWSGAQVVGLVLHQAATKQARDESKATYDTRIFCLNTLANVVGDEPNGDIRRILNELEVPQSGRTNGSKKSVHFLSWLTNWLISQTESFRDSIMKGSFGGNGNSSSSSQQHSARELEKHEDDLLNTAGNGCVLLACLLMEPPSKAAANDEKMAGITQNIRETILAGMPLDESTGLPSGTTFIKNTLRAFSNFLYFSMGDLSVAVLGPVRELLEKLEKIQVEAEIVSSS